MLVWACFYFLHSSVIVLTFHILIWFFCNIVSMKIYTSCAMLNMCNICITDCLFISISLFFYEFLVFLPCLCCSFPNFIPDLYCKLCTHYDAIMCSNISKYFFTYTSNTSTTKPSFAVLQSSKKVFIIFL